MWIQFDLKEYEARGLDYLEERIAHYQELENDPNAAKYRAAAKSNAEEGELEVDDDAVVSMGGDPGAYVMSWQWVGMEEAGVGCYSEEEKDGPVQ